MLITKALIELPPKFANRPPVNPESDPMGLNAVRGRNQKLSTWRGAAGLADDVRYYGRKMRDLAWDRIGHLYPKAKLPDGGEATVIAWLWARTVPCPNPACGVEMPLMRNWQLSKKKKNLHWMRPVVDNDAKSVSFTVQNSNKGVPPTGTVTRNGATCIACNSAVSLEYVRQQSKAGNMGEVMTCVVAKGKRNRIFLPPTSKWKKIALTAAASWKPPQRMPSTAYKVSGRGYGITHWHQLFTERQLATLATFCDLLPEIKEQVMKDGATAEYADTIAAYLALAVGKLADSNSSFATYLLPRENVSHVFARQAIPMVWDFAEGNPFSEAAGTWNLILDKVAKVLERFPDSVNYGQVHQADAATSIHGSNGPVIITDPPYYDNISYAELSDFFYVWLRRLLQDTYPDLFSGILVPTQDEMIAAPRFENAKTRFETLLMQWLHLIREQCSPEFPSSIFYAYKQQEEERGGRTSTGWDTMLSALVSTGFQIVGTWPMRTEFASRSNAMAANTLASSVVLVCRVRSSDATVATRREFINKLKVDLPRALVQMQSGNTAPVDLAQAAIGPGMAVFTSFDKVLDASGKEVSVREALALINQALDEALADQEGDFDAGTRWALAWFEQSSFAEGAYGLAETLSKAKNTSVSGMVEAGILEVGLGKVRLLRPNELPDDWDPERKGRFTDWEAVHHLVRVLDQGELAAADMITKLGARAETARELTYRLYRICDVKNLSQEAQSYNGLVQSWPEIARLAGDRSKVRQGALVGEDWVSG